MEKKIDEEINSLATEWEGYLGSRVQAFIKSEFKKSFGYSKRSDNKEDDGFFHLRFFRTEDDFNNWNTDKETYASNVLSDVTLPDSTSSAVSYIVALENKSDKIITTTDKSVKVNIRFTSQVYNPITQTTKNTDEQGELTIQTKMEGATAWTTKVTHTINSDDADDPTSYQTVDISDYLVTGTQLVRMIVKGSTSGAASTYISLSVTMTNLSMQYSVDWENVFTYARYPVISIPIFVTGTVAKVLHLNVAGTNYSKDYTYTLGTSVYSSTPYVASIDHPNAHGVYTITGYLESGSVKTASVILRIMCTVEGGNTNLIVLNDVQQSIANWSNVIPFKYAIYNPSSQSTDVTFNLMNDGKTASYWSEKESAVANGVQKTLQFSLEVETDTTDSFNARMEFLADDGSNIRDILLFKIDNSENFAPTSGADFILNPKTRSNNETTPETIINTANGSTVPSTWTGFVHHADGWVADESLNRCLRVLSGERLNISYEPFSDDTGTYGLTMEFDIAVRNSTDETAQILGINTTLSADNQPLGLMICPHQVFFMTKNKRVKLDQDAGFEEDVRTHISINIVNNLYASKINYVRIFVNGTNAREFVYTDTDAFWQAVNGVKSSGGIQIGCDTADVDIYGIRIYKANLSESSIRKDFMATIPDVTDKKRYKYNNEIVGDSGEIDYQKVLLRYNTMVLTGRRPSLASPSSGTCDLSINIIGDAAHSGTINHMTTKGQGSTSKKYWKWNCQYGFSSDSVWTDGNGTAHGACYQIAEGQPLAKKLVDKINWASSMQSHKPGATAAYNDLYKAVVGNTGITATEGYENCRVSVYQRPFFLFVKDTETSDPVFYSLVTFGAAKADAPTFGYDKTKFPDYLLIEGSDNNPALTLCHVPWITEDVVYSDDEGGWVYNGITSFDYDLGNKDRIDKFIAAHNFVWQCSNRLKPYAGTAEALQADATLDKTYQYWVTKSSTGAAQYDLFRYDYLTSSWVGSGLTKSGSGTYSVLNLKTQLSSYLLGFDTNSDVVNEEWDNVNGLFISARLMMFKDGASKYYNIQSMLFAMNFLKMHGASDNRAKNTYLFVDPVSGLICFAQDDLDTIIMTNNQGQKDKPYYVEEHDKDANGKFYWNGENNTLYNVVEQSFADEQRSNMRAMLTEAAKLGGGTLDGYLQKYFYSVTDYFPSVAYNLTAKLLYEEAEKHYGVDYTNDTDPITQSLGSQAECEKQWWKQRIPYISSYACYGEFSSEPTGGSITFRTTESTTVHFDLTPSMWLYPTVTLGQTLVQFGKRVKAGETLSLNVPTDSNTQMYITGANYMDSIGKWVDKPANGAFTFIGSKIKELVAGTTTGETVHLKITGVTVKSMKNLRTLNLANLTTLTGELDVSELSKLQTLNMSGTTITSVDLPANSQYLKEVHYPSTITDIRLDNIASLKTVKFDGVTNLQNVYINQKDISSVDTYSLIKMIAAQSANIESIELYNVNWSNCSVDILNYLLKMGAKVTGKINVADESTDKKYFSYSLKKTMVDTFGNIDSESNALYVTYTKKYTTTLGMRHTNDLYVIGKHTLTLVPYPPSANDISVTTNSLGKAVMNTKWSIETAAQNYVTVTDEYNGIFETTNNTSSSAFEVTCTVTLQDGTTKVVTQKMEFYRRIPHVGDFAYCDGSFSAVYNSNVSIVGIVFKVDKLSDTQYKATSVSLSDLTSYPWGLCPDGSSSNGFTNGSGSTTIETIINNAVKDSDEAKAISYTDCFDINSIPDIQSTGLTGSISDSTYIDDTKDDGYKVLTSGTCNDYEGKTYTEQIILHSKLILKYYLGGSYATYPSDYNALLTAIEAISTAHDARYKQFYYPAAAQCYLYEPAVNEDETLADQYKATNWYLPSTGEISRIYNFKRLGMDSASLSTSATSVNEARTPIFANANKASGTSLISFSNDWYWTSSEYGASGAWMVNFGSGGIGYGNKYYSYRVRAVVAYTFTL
jgi:hypothetical protein